VRLTSINLWSKHSCKLLYAMPLCISQDDLVYHHGFRARFSLQPHGQYVWSLCSVMCSQSPLTKVMPGFDDCWTQT
jgi:hypothetical protein